MVFYALLGIAAGSLPSPYMAKPRRSIHRRCFYPVSHVFQASMVKDSRVTYRRRHSYNTESNKVHVVKTPGA